MPTTWSPDAPLPSLEAAYDLGPEIGRGGFAVVYGATQRSNGEAVVVKLSHQGLTPDVEERVLREARLARGLEHPNLIRFHGLFLDRGGRQALVYQRIDGIGLDEVVATGEPGQELVCDWTDEVAGALDTLHRAGLVHRDVKPGNILVDEEGRSMLLDLGLLKPEESGETVTQEGILVGTPAYMAPEQFMTGATTPEVDRYALGCLVFELLTGRPPYLGSPAEIMSGHLGGNPPRVSELRSDLPAAIQPVLDRALARSPGDRHPSCRAFAEALRAAWTGEPVASGTSTEILSAGGLGGNSLPIPNPGVARGRPPPRALPGGGSSILEHPRRNAFLVVSVILLGLGAGWLGTSSRPRDLRWRVVGDQLVCEFRPGGADGLRLRIDGADHPGTPEVREDGFSFLVGALPPGEEVAAQLVWSEGSSPAQVFQGEGPPLRVEGPEPGEKLLLRGLRPCQLLRDDERLELEPGDVVVDADWFEGGSLRGREEGLAFQVPLSIESLHGRVHQLLLMQADAVDLERVVSRRHGRKARIKDFQSTRDFFAGWGAWVSRALVGPLSRDRRRALWKLWQTAERSRVQALQVPRQAPPFGLAPGSAGARTSGRDLVGEGWRKLPGVHRQKLVTPPISELGIVPTDSNAAPSYQVTWQPPRIPAGSLVELAVLVEDMDHRAEVLLATTESEEETLVVAFWDPSEPPNPKKLFDGWLRVLLPEDLLPRPGESVELTYPTLLGLEVAYVKIREARIRVLRPPGA